MREARGAFRHILRTAVLGLLVVGQSISISASAETEGARVQRLLDQTPLSSPQIRARLEQRLLALRARDADSNSTCMDMLAFQEPASPDEVLIRTANFVAIFDASAPAGLGTWLWYLRLMDGATVSEGDRFKIYRGSLRAVLLTLNLLSSTSVNLSSERISILAEVLARVSKHMIFGAGDPRVQPMMEVIRALPHLNRNLQVELVSAMMANLDARTRTSFEKELATLVADVSLREYEPFRRPLDIP